MKSGLGAAGIMADLHCSSAGEIICLADDEIVEGKGRNQARLLVRISRPVEDWGGSRFPDGDENIGNANPNVADVSAARCRCCPAFPA